MKLQISTPNSINLIIAIGIANLFSSCTSVRHDDHSYVSVYQHQDAPPRQVVETVTTNSTRTRRYAVPEAAIPTERDGTISAANDPDFREDPLFPSPGVQRNGR
jgi:hypothetical protein